MKLQTILRRKMDLFRVGVHLLENENPQFRGWHIVSRHLKFEMAEIIRMNQKQNFHDWGAVLLTPCVIRPCSPLARDRGYREQLRWNLESHYGLWLFVWKNDCDTYETSRNNMESKKYGSTRKSREIFRVLRRKVSKLVNVLILTWIFVAPLVFTRRKMNSIPILSGFLNFHVFLSFSAAFWNQRLEPDINKKWLYVSKLHNSSAIRAT